MPNISLEIEPRQSSIFPFIPARTGLNVNNRGIPADFPECIGQDKSKCPLPTAPLFLRSVHFLAKRHHSGALYLDFAQDLDKPVKKGSGLSGHQSSCQRRGGWRRRRDRCLASVSGEWYPDRWRRTCFLNAVMCLTVWVFTTWGRLCLCVLGYLTWVGFLYVTECLYLKNACSQFMPIFTNILEINHLWTIPTICTPLFIAFF